MKTCPICETALNNPVPDFCETCGWELRSDLTLVPSLDLPESVIDGYNKRKMIARGNWTKMAQAVERSEAMEKKVRELKRASLPEGVNPPAETKSTDSNVVDTSGNDTQETPLSPGRAELPELTRDPFETFEEFEERINAHPPVPAGKAELIKSGYNIETGRFPVKITWEIESDALPGIPSDCEEGYIVAERDSARAMYASGKTHPVCAVLNAEKDNVTVSGFAIFWDGRRFEVSGCESESREALPDTPGAVWTEPATGMEFMYVPGGKFLMGDFFDEGSEDEKPVHKVRVDPFFIGKYPVTQGQWKKIMGENPSECQAGDEYPVENVSWNDAKDFVRKLSEANGDNFDFRLPSEAQWEYAARSGGQLERYADIDETVPSACLKDQNEDHNEEFSEEFVKRLVEGQEDHIKKAGEEVLKKVSEILFGFVFCAHTNPVGLQKPNGLGIYDTSANVGEWCEDDRHDNYQGAPGSATAWVEEPRDSERIYRGRSCDTAEESYRATSRYSADEFCRNRYLGFRVAMMPVRS